MDDVGAAVLKATLRSGVYNPKLGEKIRDRHLQSYRMCKFCFLSHTVPPQVEAMRIATAKPSLTRARALLIRLMDLYRIPGYSLSLLEIQKLAYFLQFDGEPMKLRYVKHKYGPYADNLNHVLQVLDGHYIRGYGDRSRRPEITLLPGGVEEARLFLSAFPEAEERLERIRRLIEGFESPYGMELLASVLWIIEENPQAAMDWSQVIAGIQEWSNRKRTLFKPEHIRKAWQRLQDEKWLSIINLKTMET